VTRSSSACQRANCAYDLCLHQPSWILFDVKDPENDSLPITPAELLFEKQEGLEALEERFEAAQFDFLDPLRASVV
jgi:hypothetical protein